MKRDLDAETRAAVLRSIENVKQAKLSAGNFVLVELQLGLEFAEFASQYRKQGNMTGAHRNIEAAKKAYESVVKFLPKAVLTVSQKKELDRELSKLKAKLNIP